MQAPHPSVLASNPAFAQLYPRLVARAKILLQPPEHEVLRDHISELTRVWIKLQIMWDELQAVLHDPQYQELVQNVSHHVASTRFASTLSQDLKNLKIPETHTFVVPPSNLQDHLAILSDVLASRLNDVLSVFARTHAELNANLDPLSVKRYHDSQVSEYRAANASLRQQMCSDIVDFYQTASATLANQADYLGTVKHGRVEKFIAAYLAYHDAASTTLLTKSRNSHDSVVSTIYTPELCRSLEQHAREIRRRRPHVQQSLEEASKGIAQRENLKTVEYNNAVAEYQSLQGAIEQARKDIDKMMHHRASM